VGAGAARRIAVSRAAARAGGGRAWRMVAEMCPRRGAI
jgi:hypothetical protein